MKDIKSIFLIIVATAIFLTLVDFAIAATTEGYRVDKTLTSSGGTISIKGLNYDVILGNGGNRIKISRDNFSTFIQYPNCKMINDSTVCFTQNLTKGNIKISVNPKYGKLDYIIKRTVSGNSIQIYVGQQVNVTVNFTNTGNMTIFPRYIDTLTDFYIKECENCIIDGNKIVFNKSIEPDDTESFTYRIIPDKKFKKSDKTPSLEFFDGVGKKTPKMEKMYYEALESFLKEINITLGDRDIFDRANISVFINNTIKTRKMNYSITLHIPKDIEVVDANRFSKDDDEHSHVKYYLKGLVKNGSTFRNLFEIRFTRTGMNTIPVTLNVWNGIINYERTYNLTKYVGFTKRPTVEYRMKEYVIGDSSPHTLQVFLGNQAEFKLKNISVRLTLQEKNYTATFPEVSGVDEVATFEFSNVSGKKIVQINTTYQTEFGETFWIYDTKEMLFPEKAGDKIDIVTPDDSNTTTIKKNETVKNTSDIPDDTGTIEEKPEKAESFFKDKSIFILLALIPIVIVIAVIVIGKASSAKAKKEEESIEEELVLEIDKLKNELNELEKREKNV